LYCDTEITETLQRHRMISIISKVVEVQFLVAFVVGLRDTWDVTISTADFAEQIGLSWQCTQWFSAGFSAAK